jgi:hypothetical protein
MWHSVFSAEQFTWEKKQVSFFTIAKNAKKPKNTKKGTPQNVFIHLSSLKFCNYWPQKIETTKKKQITTAT